MSTIKHANNKFDLDSISKEYDESLTLYRSLKSEGEHILSSALDKTEIKIHSITSRVKEKESFLKKTESKNTSKINDIVGLRVICLFLSDIIKIKDIIFDNFEVLSEDDKINGEDNQNNFGYMSVHYIVKIKESFSGSRYDLIKGIPFEIQVRTISMEAWANISHYLDYKSENDVPTELRRDFNAISGLFYVADTHFEMFYKDSNDNKNKVEKKIQAIISDSKHDNSSEQEVNMDSLLLYLHNKFPDRKHYKDRNISKLVNELISTNYHTIETLNNAVDNGLKAFEKYEEAKGDPCFYSSVGLVRNLLAISDKNFRLKYYPDDIFYEQFEQYL